MTISSDQNPTGVSCDIDCCSPFRLLGVVSLRSHAQGQFIQWHLVLFGHENQLMLKSSDLPVNILDRDMLFRGRNQSMVAYEAQKRAASAKRHPSTATLFAYDFLRPN